ncbi:MAG: stage III sporulation protein AB [Clostridia bacterium]
MSEILRLLAGGLLALCCCYIGIVIKRHYVEREKFYLAALEFATLLSSELSFKKTPFPKVVETFSFGRKGVFVSAVNEYVVELQKGATFEKMLADINIPRLKNEEKKSLISFFSELGKTSLDDQLGLIARASKEFEIKHKKCEEESRKLGGMYFKLAVLLGIAIIVILA